MNAIIRRLSTRTAAFCLLWATAATSAQSQYGKTELKRDIESSLRGQLFQRTSAAVEISDAGTGEVLYDRNSELLLRPASAAKLFTTAAALLGLPRDFAFKTTVYIDSSGGGLPVIWIRGGGDPLLDSGDLAALADAVVGSGIFEFEALVLDATLFDTVRYNSGWMLGDLGEQYCPAVTPFSVNGNRLIFRFKGGTKPGDPLDIGTHNCSAAELLLDCRTGYSNALSVTGDPRLIEYRSASTDYKGKAGHAGYRAAGFLKTGSIKTIEMGAWDPPSLFHCLLLSSLEKRGVRVRNRLVLADIVPASAFEAGSVTRPIGDVIEAINRESDNLAAECLLKRFSAERNGVPGGWSSGISEIRRMLSRVGVDSGSMSLADGSGMSHYNLASASSFGKLLRGMCKTPVFEMFKASLAKPGGPGTLRNRFAGINGAHFVRAKTGTISGVSALCGYVLKPEGPPLAFAILMQNFAGSHAAYRNIQDKIVGYCLRYASSSSR